LLNQEVQKKEDPLCLIDIIIMAPKKATRRFPEAAGLMGLETSVPSLFGGQAGASTAVRKILDINVGRFGSRVDEQTLINDPLAHAW
jgi:hypothetical protein